MDNKSIVSQFASITATQALKRSSSVPSCALIAPSGSGKTTLINSVVNSPLAKALKGGISKNQTTLFSTDFILDSRIADDHQFTLQVNTKSFDAKLVQIVLKEQLFELFKENGFSAEDTVGSMDDNKWIKKVLEPEDSSFHLLSLQNEIDLHDLQEAVLPLLENIEQQDDKSFIQLAKERKESIKLKKTVSEVHKMLFDELWDGQETELKELNLWLNNLENILMKRLITLIMPEDEQDINKINLTRDNILLNDANKNMLEELYTPSAPFSLIIEDVKIACRPREEVVKFCSTEYPFRFCLRDTVGLTQTGIDDESIGSALDVAMNYNLDSILILFSLEERNDVLKKSCKAIANKMKAINGSSIILNMLFTKADHSLDTKINSKKEGLVLSEDDYLKNIEGAVYELNEEIKGIANDIPNCRAEWICMHYQDESMHQIQMALKNLGYVEIQRRFKPEGLYQAINSIAQDIQTSLLPESMKNPIFVTTNDPNENPILISFNTDEFLDIAKSVQDKLVKEWTSKYLIMDEYMIHGRSVTTYWRRLQQGLGHETRSNVYGNFNIHMKSLLKNALNYGLGSLDNLYDEEASMLITDNLQEAEVQNLIKYFSVEGRGLDDYVDMTMNEILYFGLQEYFNKDLYNWQYSIFDKVAFRLSYENEYIKQSITPIYIDPAMSYNMSIRCMQKEFFEIFSSDKFLKILAQELSNAINEKLSKLFIAI